MDMMKDGNSMYTEHSCSNVGFTIVCDLVYSLFSLEIASHPTIMNVTWLQCYALMGFDFIPQSILHFFLVC